MGQEAELLLEEVGHIFNSKSNAKTRNCVTQTRKLAFYGHFSLKKNCQSFSINHITMKHTRKLVQIEIHTAK